MPILYMLGKGGISVLQTSIFIYYARIRDFRVYNASTASLSKKTTNTTYNDVPLEAPLSTRDSTRFIYLKQFHVYYLREASLVANYL